MTGEKKQPQKVPVGGGTVGLKSTLNTEHEARWSAKSYAILGILLALLLGLVSLISYGIYELLPLSTGLKIALSVIIFCALVIIGWRQRYRVLMFIRWLDRKSVAKKTYHGK